MNRENLKECFYCLTDYAGANFKDETLKLFMLLKASKFSIAVNIKKIDEQFSTSDVKFV